MYEMTSACPAGREMTSGCPAGRIMLRRDSGQRWLPKVDITLRDYHRQPRSKSESQPRSKSDFWCILSVCLWFMSVFVCGGLDVEIVDFPLRCLLTPQCPTADTLTSE